MTRNIGENVLAKRRSLNVERGRNERNGNVEGEGRNDETQKEEEG